MSTQVAFLVVRVSLMSVNQCGSPELLADDSYQPLRDEDRGPVWVPEAAFSTRAAAERERERRELAARELLNPFWLDPVDSLSSCTETGFRERLREFGLTPPEPVRGPPQLGGDMGDWAPWWDAESGAWSDELRAAVWELLDKVRLFEVVETELE